MQSQPTGSLISCLSEDLEELNQLQAHVCAFVAVIRFHEGDV